MASFGFPPFKVCFHIVGKAQPAEIVRVIVQGVAVDMVHGCLLLRVCVFAERRSDKATDKIEKRVAQQYPTLRPGGQPYKIVFQESAMYEDGDSFMDHDIHRYLVKHGFERVEEVKETAVSSTRHAITVVTRW